MMLSSTDLGPWHWKCQAWWTVPWKISVELNIVFVPFDAVEGLSLQVIVTEQRNGLVHLGNEIILIVTFDELSRKSQRKKVKRKKRKT